MAMLKEQVSRVSPPQWVRVIGGVRAHQFAEKPLQPSDEINRQPRIRRCSSCHCMTARCLTAQLFSVGYTKDTPIRRVGH